MRHDTKILAAQHGKPLWGNCGAQTGALCWAIRDGKLRILMITSRNTRRWILPKGWVEQDRTDSEVAELEAWEEAGVTGKIGKKRLGRYRYIKQDVLKGQDLPCTVDIYPLKVRALAKRWPERHQRQRRWMSPRRAAKAVWEPELAQLIRHFSPQTRKGA